MEDTCYNDKVFSYRECSDCQVIFIDPFPDSGDYEKMYSDYTDHIYESATGRYAALLEKVIRVHPGAVSLADYGCGNAELMQDAASKGFEVTGIEYDPGFVAKLKSRLPAFSFETIEEFPGSPESYDIIVMNNVLEHVTNPNEILKLIRYKLNENGLILCLGPIENNFTLAQVFRRMMFGLRKRIRSKKADHPPYHITFTNYTNQKGIFEKNGFKEVFMETDEDPWPFPEEIRSQSFTNTILAIIARISVKLSRKLSKKAGNTFIYLGRK